MDLWRSTVYQTLKVFRGRRSSENGKPLEPPCGAEHRSVSRESVCGIAKTRISSLLKKPEPQKMIAALSFANERLPVLSVIDHELSLKMLPAEIHGVSP